MEKKQYLKKDRKEVYEGESNVNDIWEVMDNGEEDKSEQYGVKVIQEPENIKVRRRRN